MSSLDYKSCLSLSPTYNYTAKLLEIFISVPVIFFSKNIIYLKPLS